jgi:hypothetical protein
MIGKYSLEKTKIKHSINGEKCKMEIKTYLKYKE